MMRSNHIVYLSEADLSLDTGRGINEREFVSALLQHGSELVTCVAPEPARPDVFCPSGIEYVAPHRGNPLLYPKFLFSAFFTIQRLHRSSKLDAVGVRLGVSPLLPYAVSRILGIPILLKMLVMPEAFAENVGWTMRGHEAVKRSFRPLYRSTIRRSLGADTASELLRDLLNDVFGFADQELIVIRNGANMRRFTPGDRSEARRHLGLGRFERLVGYVGNLGDDRHVNCLILAFAQMRSDAGTGLVLVGDGEARPSLERLAQREGIGDRVVFTGKVPYGEVVHYIRSFDVAVDLSAIRLDLAGEKHFGSWSQKIAQYLACGRPVVVWDIGDNHFLADAGVAELASLRDIPSLVEAIETLLKFETQERVQIQERAREFAERELGAEKLARDRLDFWRARIGALGGSEND